MSATTRPTVSCDRVQSSESSDMLTLPKTIMAMEIRINNKQEAIYRQSPWQLYDASARAAVYLADQHRISPKTLESVGQPNCSSQAQHVHTTQSIRRTRRRRRGRPWFGGPFAVGGKVP